jgi:hypothetical protein
MPDAKRIPSEARSPLGAVLLKYRMRDEAMPDDGVESLGMRSNQRVIDGRDYNHVIAHLFRKAAVPTHDPENFGLAFLG